MFDEVKMEKSVKKMLVKLLWRLLFALVSLALVVLLRPGLIGAVFILATPFVVYQAILDKKIIVPKLVTIFLWITIMYLTSMMAGLLGLLGVALFMTGYILWKVYKSKDDETVRLGFDLIKNRKKYAEEIVNDKRH